MISVSTGTRGAIAELRIACNLMSLGWSIYRCYSPNAAADLIAAKGRVVLRVQVKSSTNGQYENLRQGSNDLLAIVTPDGEIRYRALTRRVANMFPACGLARRPKAAHPATRHATRKAA
jgi:PD-(D/E)XK endonuclease